MGQSRISSVLFDVFLADRISFRDELCSIYGFGFCPCGFWPWPACYRISDSFLGRGLVRWLTNLDVFPPHKCPIGVFCGRGALLTSSRGRSFARQTSPFFCLTFLDLGWFGSAIFLGISDCSLRIFLISSDWLLNRFNLAGLIPCVSFRLDRRAYQFFLIQIVPCGLFWF